MVVQVVYVSIVPYFSCNFSGTRAVLSNQTYHTIIMIKKTSLRLPVICGSLLALMSQAYSNPIVIGNSRFTFITPGLVRLEYANDAKFIDDKTFFAQNRDVDFKDVKVEKKEDNKYTLSTSKMRIEFVDNGYPFGQMTCRVFYTHEGKEQSWLMSHRQKRNLKGAITTLDDIGSPVPLQEGLLSRDGWYVINDTGKELYKNGWFEQRDASHVQDVYLFIYGDDYKSALKSLQTVSGPAPMPRKYVHGSWYCRWWDYTADEFKAIPEDYRKHDFPLDILVFDMGWHTIKTAKNGTGHAGNLGWTGYTWNRELIPDPAGLIGDLKKDNISVVLNEHPHDGIRDHDDAYPALMKDLGLDPSEKKNVLFDAGDKKYMDAFMKHAHKESDDMGVAFWWLDWQQDYLYPYVRGTDMRHLSWLNHIYFNYSKQGNLRGAGFSRWAGFGDHRHPIQFSGDSVGNWEMLKFEIELTSTSGNAGCFFWAHDLGGFYGGTDPELFTRWIQFGLLNSSLRLHSVYDPKLDRRPWLWGEAEEKAMKTVYHMRSQMMPYIYSSVRQCNADMLPLNRAMYIDYPQEEEAYENPQQFMFGDLLLGAPITSAGEGDNKAAKQEVWLPAGDVWYQVFSGQKYDGGQKITETCDLGSFPLYIKGGYPFPMQPYTDRMASAELKQLVVRCYPAASHVHHSYELYEDDGMTRDYEEGKFATTKMGYALHGDKTTITIQPVKGEYNGQVKARSYRFELASLNSCEDVTVNGEKVEARKDDSIKGFVVDVPETKIDQKVVLNFRSPS